MSFRTSLIGVVAAGVVLLGNSANAAPSPGASRSPVPAGAKSTDRYVVVVNVYGRDNVIATDRSVLAAGEGTRLNGNTGDVSASGTLGIDNNGSALESGTSMVGARDTPARSADLPGNAPPERSASTPQRWPVAGAGHVPPGPAGLPIPESGMESTKASRFPFPIPLSGTGKARPFRDMKTTRRTSRVKARSPSTTTPTCSSNVTGKSTPTPGTPIRAA
ncbi:hypothetical protein GEV43_11880 [Actinomadura sp. J1-007]|uniref:hypothetical protein n=1 Tax=Actinomadura sp. J1-007 TaxID=2661913 RepID=UPI00132A1479|nr:hypothetical protein [Actinomadura sp. J1-007]MWK34674.1 hypothetical protein [Actinomadura sp. J1-007]